MPNQLLPTIGFLGADAIVDAMVSGFCTRGADTPYPIVVSDAKPEARERLQAKFPRRVTATETLQECVDQSDWVVIAVWPHSGEEVIRSLKFRPEHKVINVMFDKTVDEIRSWMNCEVSTMLHMIPGTFLSSYEWYLGCSLANRPGSSVSLDNAAHARLASLMQPLALARQAKIVPTNRAAAT